MATSVQHNAQINEAQLHKKDKTNGNVKTKPASLKLDVIKLDMEVVQTLAKAQMILENLSLKEAMKNMESSSFSQRIQQSANEAESDLIMDELKTKLEQPHMMHLLEAHDTILKNQINSEVQLHGIPSNGSPTPLLPKGDIRHLTWDRAIRLVGLEKKSWEPLGLTVVTEKDELVVARILHGSQIQNQGLLHVGDIIREVNGICLNGCPHKLRDYLAKTTGRLIFKILPSYENELPPKQIYVKCHIDYDPTDDTLIPCPEAGLKFTKGTILQIVDQDDPKWWQARIVNNKGEPRGRAGLIPSQALEEKRKSAKDSAKKSKKKSKKLKMYRYAENSTFDKLDIAVYEEVACMPPFTRKTLVLLVNSQTFADDLAQAIIRHKSDLYDRPHKSRSSSTPEEVRDWDNTDDENVAISPLHSETFSEINGYDVSDIKQVMIEGKTCVLIVSPQSLKLLKTSFFMPYVIFIKTNEENGGKGTKNKVFTISESDIENYYSQYIDETFSKKEPDELAKEIIQALEKLKTRHQWVPTSWVY